MQEAGIRLITQAKVDAKHIARDRRSRASTPARRSSSPTGSGSRAYLTKRFARPLYDRALVAQAKRLARRAGADPEDFVP